MNDCFKLFGVSLEILETRLFFPFFLNFLEVVLAGTTGLVDRVTGMSTRPLDSEVILGEIFLDLKFTSERLFSSRAPVTTWMGTLATFPYATGVVSVPTAILYDLQLKTEIDYATMITRPAERCIGTDIKDLYFCRPECLILPILIRSDKTKTRLAQIVMNDCLYKRAPTLSIGECF